MSSCQFISKYIYYTIMVILFELVSLNKCLVTARLVTFMITEVFMDGFDMVPQSGNSL